MGVPPGALYVYFMMIQIWKNLGFPIMMGPTPYSKRKCSREPEGINPCMSLHDYYPEVFALNIFKYGIPLIQPLYEVGFGNGALYIRRLQLRGFE